MFPLLYPYEIEPHQNLRLKAWLPAYTLLLAQFLFLLGLALTFLFSNLAIFTSLNANALVVIMPFWIGSMLAIFSPFFSYMFVRDYIEKVIEDPAIQTDEKNTPGLITTVLPHLFTSFASSILYLLFMLSSLLLFLHNLYQNQVLNFFGGFFSLCGYLVIWIFGFMFHYKHSYELLALGAMGIISTINKFAKGEQPQISPFEIFDIFLLIIMMSFISIMATYTMFCGKRAMKPREYALYVFELLIIYSLEGFWIGCAITLCADQSRKVIYPLVSIHFLIAIVLLGATRFFQLNYEFLHSPLGHRMDLHFCWNSRPSNGFHVISKKQRIAIRNGPFSSTYYFLKSLYLRIVRNYRHLRRQRNSRQIIESSPLESFPSSNPLLSSS